MAQIRDRIPSLRISLGLWFFLTMVGPARAESTVVLPKIEDFSTAVEWAEKVIVLCQEDDDRRQDAIDVTKGLQPLLDAMLPILQDHEDCLINAFEVALDRPAAEGSDEKWDDYANPREALKGLRDFSDNLFAYMTPWGPDIDGLQVSLIHRLPVIEDILRLLAQAQDNFMP